jgi:hypothetical protein
MSNSTAQVVQCLQQPANYSKAGLATTNNLTNSPTATQQVQKTAQQNGYSYFAISGNNQLYYKNLDVDNSFQPASCDVHKDSKNRPFGKWSVNAVYQANPQNANQPLQFMGCYADQENPRAIPNLQPNPMTIEQCYQSAISSSKNANATQYIGMQNPEASPTTGLSYCFTGTGDWNSASQYGPTNCSNETDYLYRPLGGTQINAVYQLDQNGNPQFVGCYNDNANAPIIPNNVGVMSINDCASRAQQNGSTIFGMQNAQGYPGTNTSQCFLANPGDTTSYAQAGPAQCSANTDSLNNPITPNTYILYDNNNENAQQNIISPPISTNSSQNPSVSSINNLVKNYSTNLGTQAMIQNQYSTTAAQVDKQIQNELTARIKQMNATSTGKAKDVIMTNYSKRNNLLTQGEPVSAESAVTEAFENVLPNLADLDANNTDLQGQIYTEESRVRLAGYSALEKNRMIRFLIGFIGLFVISLIPIYGVLTGTLSLRTVLIFVIFILFLGTAYYYFITRYILDDNNILDKISKFAREETRATLNCPNK